MAMIAREEAERQSESATAESKSPIDGTLR
jgi:hypothetical protein